MAEKKTVRGILFDKDGTLFDFGATWNAWAADLLEELAEGRPDLCRAMAEAIHFDLERKIYHPTSPVIAGTNGEAARLLLTVLPGWDREALERHMALRAAQAPLTPATALRPLLGALRARGLVLGVMTNDTESSALAQLGAAGVRDEFAFIAGFDSGHGAKPAPDPLLAFASATGLAPQEVVMVGDSRHDLVAGRAAGMGTIGVLTGMAPKEELSPLADVVLPDIGHIPAWLDR